MFRVVRFSDPNSTSSILLCASKRQLTTIFGNGSLLRQTIVLLGANVQYWPWGKTVDKTSLLALFKFPAGHRARSTTSGGSQSQGTDPTVNGRLCTPADQEDTADPPNLKSPPECCFSLQLDAASIVCTCQYSWRGVRVCVCEWRPKGNFKGSLIKICPPRLFKIYLCVCVFKIYFYVS